MKNKFILLSFLMIILCLFFSCYQDTNPNVQKSDPVKENEDSKVTIELINGIENSLGLMQKTEYVFNKTHPAYYDKIINYGNSYDKPDSYEIFDYTDYDFDSKTGKYVSKVSEDIEGNTIYEESIVIIEYKESLFYNYVKTCEYFKYENGVKDKKAYLVEYTEAEDVDFTRPTFITVYSPKNDGMAYSITNTWYDFDTNLPILLEEFNTNGVTREETNRSSLTGLTRKTMKVYDYDEESKKCKSILSLNFEDNPKENPDIYITNDCFDYDADVYEGDYILKRTSAGFVIDGYTILFKNGEGILLDPDWDAIEFKDMPASYEGIKYEQYGDKNYPVIISTMNENWEIENKIKKSYAKMPDSATEYYECESSTYSRRSAQKENDIILEEDTRTKKTFYKDENDVLTMIELIYADKSKYSSSVSETSTL